MKKLITVSFVATVAVEVPEGVTDQMIFDGDERRVCVTPEVEKIITAALKGAQDALGWRDGEITDIEDAEDSSDKLVETGVWTK